MQGLRHSMEGRMNTFVFGFEGGDDVGPHLGCFANEDEGNRLRHDAVEICGNNVLAEFGDSLRSNEAERSHSICLIRRLTCWI
jgi:hypothetical protein